MSKLRVRTCAVLWLAVGTALAFCRNAESADETAASRDGMYFPTATTQTESDEYTRYELLAPETASLRFRATRGRIRATHSAGITYPEDLRSVSRASCARGRQKHDSLPPRRASDPKSHVQRVCKGGGIAKSKRPADWNVSHRRVTDRYVRRGVAIEVIDRISESHILGHSQPGCGATRSNDARSSCA